MRTVPFVLLVATLTTVMEAQSPAATSEAARLDRISDRFFAQQLAYDPTASYRTGQPARNNSRFPDRSVHALQMLAVQEQNDLRDLLQIQAATLPPASRSLYANLREQLESDIQMRVCRHELWDVDHMDGWQLAMVDIAGYQPVGTLAERTASLVRWRTFPAVVDTEIRNLNAGLAQGYSAPQSVTKRVIAQIDTMLASPPEKSPFASPAERATDSAFQGAFLAIVRRQIDPALKRYRDYLQGTYLPHARTTIALADLPNGPACYAAFLRANTTLQRTPAEVMAVGENAVAANLAAVQGEGEQRFDTREVTKIVTAMSGDTTAHFASREALINFTNAFLERAAKQTAAAVIDHVPSQPVVVRIMPGYEEAAGGNSRYIREGNRSKPATFILQTGNWETITRAEIEITVVHEALPGHHLQFSFATEQQTARPVMSLLGNSAYTEGWARYAEGMGAELHIYDTPDADIRRRLWAARGMVVDPGLHALHWTRQQAVDYIVASGRFTPEQAEEQVDRIAAMPGQLTSYDSGGQEILALRREAENQLGTRFDLRGFNHALLEEGIVPLPELRIHVQNWLSQQHSSS